MNAVKTNSERFSKHYSIDSDTELEALYDRIGVALNDYEDLTDDECERLARIIDNILAESDTLTVPASDVNEYKIAKEAINDLE